MEETLDSAFIKVVPRNLVVCWTCGVGLKSNANFRRHVVHLHPPVDQLVDGRTRRNYSKLPLALDSLRESNDADRYAGRLAADDLPQKLHEAWHDLSAGPKLCERSIASVLSKALDLMPELKLQGRSFIYFQSLQDQSLDPDYLPVTDHLSCSFLWYVRASIAAKQGALLDEFFAPTALDGQLVVPDSLLVSRTPSPTTGNLSPGPDDTSAVDPSDVSQPPPQSSSTVISSYSSYNSAVPYGRPCTRSMSQQP